MRTKSIIAIVVLAACGLTATTYAQDESTEKKTTKLSLGLGINLLGPAPVMARLMRQNAFDYTTDNWFSNSLIQHPNYPRVGFTAQFNFSTPIKPRKQIGFILSRALLREVSGAHQSAGYLFVKFTNTSIIPYYSTTLRNDQFELQFGPAFMINKGNKTSSMSSSSEDYTAYTAGLLAGLNMKFSEGKKSFSNLNMQLILAPPNQMGPYSSSLKPEVKIQKTDIWFTHLNIIYQYGFKFK